jgi:hypothetical protein
VNLSVTANEKGDACVRSRGEESYIVVSELMGNDFYRVKPNEQVVFHAGQAKDPQVNGDMTCGCPGPAPVERAEAVVPPAALPIPMIGSTPLPPAVIPTAPVSPPVQQATAAPVPPPPTAAQEQAGLAALSSEAAVAAAANASAVFPAPPRSGQVEVQVDAPMIYDASGVPPDLTATLARVHVEHLPWPDAPAVAAQPPQVVTKQATSATVVEPAAPEKPKKSFFRKVGGFFAAIFK